MAKNQGGNRFRSSLLHVLKYPKRCYREDKIKGNTYFPNQHRNGAPNGKFTERGNIVNKIRDIYGEKNEKKERKKLMQELYDLWKNETLATCHKPIYSLRLNGEESPKKRRVFSKIFKLDENNQYGFAMTKSLPIGIFKRRANPTMDILKKSLENFDPNA